MPGWSTSLDQDNLTSVPVVLRSQKCTVTAIRAFAATNNACTIHVHDAASATGITTGTTIPKWWVVCPSGNASDGDGLPTDGISFANGVVVASSLGLQTATSGLTHVRITIR